MGFTKKLLAGLLAVGFIGAALLAGRPAQTWAAEQPLSIQVSPSPIVEVLKPGESKTLELKILNTGGNPATLKLGLADFTVSKNGDVQLLDSNPDDISGWITFADPTFTAKPGEWFTERIKVDVPKDAGFSYTFAITISNAAQATQKPGQQTLQGKVAVFSLLTIDKPGATRKFEVESFQSAKRLYEYLPADFSFKINNTGNTIVRPFGNIFIQRSGSSKAIATLPLNEKGSYIIPNSGRTLTANWADGFPVYKEQKQADNVAPKKTLAWEWNQMQHFRFGHYTAKMVAVYNDGQRDVPVEAEVSFWVVPWKLLVGLFVMLIVLGVGMTVIIRRAAKLSRYARGYHHHD